MVSVGYFIARRYLLSKNSLSIITIMSLICMLVVAVVTMAMVVILSAFNGIESLIDDRYKYFDADLSVKPLNDKVIHADSLDKNRILALPGMVACTESIEEYVLAEYDGNQRIVIVKGVESSFVQTSGLDSMLLDGVADLALNNKASSIIGVGVKYDLNLRMFEQAYNPLRLKAIQRGKKLGTNVDAFTTRGIPVAGIFSINIDFDSDYVIVPLAFAAELLSYKNEYSALEIQIEDGVSLDDARQLVQEAVGADYEVKSRLQKNELVYKTNKTEKWATFVIMGFIMLIATFNIIAALTLLINEKRRDIRILSGMGASPALIKRIFFIEGALINAVGASVGLCLGLLLVYLQQNYGLIRLEGGLVDYYPVEIANTDLLAIFALVVSCGIVSSIAPVQIFTRKYAGLR